MTECGYPGCDMVENPEGVILIIILVAYLIWLKWLCS